MFKIKVEETPVLFAKPFNAADSKELSEAVKNGEVNDILCIDTPAAEYLVDAIGTIVSNGVNVVVKDHHNILNPKVDNNREMAIADAVKSLMALVDSSSTFSDRDSNPACSSLVELGEFSDIGLVVADPDADGLLGAMKALGLTYDELDSDAAFLDGPRSLQNSDNLSETALLLQKGMATLPGYNPKNPEFSQMKKAELFQMFVNMVSGDVSAREFLEKKVADYEAGVAIAKEILGKKDTSIEGMTFIDISDEKRKFDFTTLVQGLEKKGIIVTVTVKGNGPIAAKHGKQVSIAVTRDFKSKINLMDLVDGESGFNPDAGVISNTSFLLHLSEEKWNEIKPQLLPLLEDLV